MHGLLLRDGATGRNMADLVTAVVRSPVDDLLQAQQLLGSSMVISRERSGKRDVAFEQGVSLHGQEDVL